jgi:transcriptional regulator of acetoin/glycerol metabolism
LAHILTTLRVFSSKTLTGGKEMNNSFVSLDAYAQQGWERNKLQHVWENFVIEKNFHPDESGLRPIMLQSWNRCLGYGVDPVSTKAPIVSTTQQVQEEFLNSQLHRYLLPYLKNIRDIMMETEKLLVVTNSKGEINHIEGKVSIQNKAEKMNFVTGSSWKERDAGTNAIGTALVTKTPIQVFSAEHLCERVHEWTCSAAPILDPATQKVLGVIDLTGVWKSVHPHALSLVLTVARAIEDGMRKDLEVDRYKVLAHYLEVSMRKTSVPLAALDYGGTVLKADPLLYENSLINEYNKLKGFAIETLQLKEEVGWEVETQKGVWKFILTPYVEYGRYIGAIVHAIPPMITSNKTAPSSTTRHSFSSMIGRSNKFIETIRSALASARTDLPILMEGESGTGKELFAQSIHRASKWADGPFVAVNCGALPKDLAVSELFGFEGGSFTGAAKGGKPGKFIQAQGGTIFLDEIGEMPLDMQTYLLRVLEEGEVVPVGAHKPIHLNVRVIAATNRDLLKAVGNGEFRRDLYYRLNILSIHIPPLRERTEDITLLMEYHIKKACRDIGRAPLKISELVIRMLQDYSWPGNVRELRNIAYRLATKTIGDVIEVCDLPNEIYSSATTYQIDLNQKSDKRLTNDKGKELLEEHLSLQKSGVEKEVTIKEKELEMILSLLEKYNGNVTQVAQKLGIHRSTIYRKLRAMDEYQKDRIGQNI